MGVRVDEARHRGDPVRVDDDVGGSAVPGTDLADQPVLYIDGVGGLHGPDVVAGDVRVAVGREVGACGGGHEAIARGERRSSLAIVWRECKRDLTWRGRR